MGTRIRRLGIAVALIVGVFGLAPRASAADPSITPPSASFAVGLGGTVTFHTHDFVATPTMDVDGALPDSVTFADNAATTGQDSATLTIPTTLPAGVYHFMVVASNDAETASDPFTLTIVAAATPTPAPVPVSGASCQTLNAAGAATKTFKRGESFFVKGFLPGVGTARVLLDAVTLIGSGATDDSGVYLVAATLPSDTFLGAHTVVARGATPTQTVRATCGINVVAGAAAAGAAGSGKASLPKTGFPTSMLIALGVTMVELGGGLLLFTDRRRAAPVIGPWLQRTIHRLEG